MKSWSEGGNLSLLHALINTTKGAQRSDVCLILSRGCNQDNRCIRPMMPLYPLGMGHVSLFYAFLISLLV